MWLGIIVILIPFLGVPIRWKEYALVSVGVLIATVAVIPGKRSHNLASRNSGSYAESQPTDSSRPS